VLYSQFIRSLNQTSYETVDITGAQMVLTMKLTTFAWNIWDGRRPAEVSYGNPCQRASSSSPSDHRSWTSGNWRTASPRCPLCLNSWVTRPSETSPCAVLFFDLARHRFYFPGFLVGPYLEYASYKALVEETVFKNAAASGKELKGGRIPAGRKRAAYMKLVTGLAFLGAFVLFGPKFNYTVALQSWFKEKPYLYRSVVVHASHMER
jgi:lysophospholipid acyltransferase